MHRSAARFLVLGAAAVLTAGSVAFVVSRPRPAPVAEIPEIVDPSGSFAPEGSYPPSMPVDELYRAFEDDGGTATTFGEATTLETITAGELVLPDASLVAADVYLFSEDPFTRPVAPGRYPVSLLSSVRDPSLAGDNAAAMIRFGPGEPVRWEMALVAGQDASSLGPDEFFGFGVDSGTACFTSVAAIAHLREADGFEAYGDQVQNDLFPPDGSVPRSTVIEVDPATGANVIAFPSGYGDGTYPSWYGLDAGDQTVVLITDFGLLDATGG